MSLSIMTNVASLGAQRHLAKTQESLSANVSRLASGLRINSAADDAAGLAISTKLSSQISGLGQAARNANDGISVVQTAEGALNEITSLLTRMRDLAVQASSSGSLGSTERGYLDNEFQSLSDEIDRIATVTEYNGQKLIDGSLSAGASFQVGIFNTANDRISVSVGSASATALGVNASSVTTAANAQTALGALDTAIGNLSTVRGTLGAAQNRLSVTISNLSSWNENLSAANSRIMDADVAAETSAYTRNQILMQAGVAVLAQANQMPSVALSLLK
jgi:flagellin